MQYETLHHVSFRLVHFTGGINKGKHRAVVVFLVKQGELYNKDEALLQTWLPESTRTPPHNP